MNTYDIKDLLEKVHSHQTSVSQAMDAINFLPFIDLGEIKLDSHREMRTGAPEAIYAPHKTPAQISSLVKQHKDNGPLFITKAEPSLFEAIKGIVPAKYYAKACIIVVGNVTTPSTQQKGIVVISAGTGDIPVAEEAAVTAEILGSTVERIYDVGAAGIHRLLSFRDIIKDAVVTIVTAGMDGMLPGIVAGLFPTPVIALPTSVGYGTGMHGYAALLTMLNSCAPGVAVVNIDNGYGAGVTAFKIARQVTEKK